MSDAERYDAMLEAGHDAPVPCCVCSGDEEAEACSEECAAIVAKARDLRVIRRLGVFVETATELAKAYRAEGGDDDPRLDAVRAEVERVQAEIERLRKGAA